MTIRSSSCTQPPLAPRTVGGAEPGRPAGLPDAGAILGRAAGENFRVASRLLPAASRAHLLAFYGYARLVDQIGDDYQGDRLAALDWVGDQVETALRSPDVPGLHPLVAAAARSVLEVGADPGALRDLVAANRMDQTVATYASFHDLVGYCELSANPVGRLVLAAFGADTALRRRWSDSVCTGLQIAEHLQDVAEDAAAGRCYLPREDMERFGVHADDLTGGPPAGTELRGLMTFEVSRARTLLQAGTALVASLPGRQKWAVAGFVAGGRAALDAVAAAGFDPLCGAARPRPVRVAAQMLSLLRPYRPAREAT
ncbi:MAG: squalene/phytoene synthase family protein [Acidimicrobiales bacterium]